MRTRRIPALVAGALLLAFGSSASLAGGAKRFEVDFDKCFGRRDDMNGNAVLRGYVSAGPACKRSASMRAIGKIQFADA